MRFLSFYILLAVVAVIAAIPANMEEGPQSLFDVDFQGHENIGNRGARQHGWGGRGSYSGGYPGGYGGHGGYGGYGGNGGYGGYSGYGNRGGYYG